MPARPARRLAACVDRGYQWVGILRQTLVQAISRRTRRHHKAGREATPYAGLKKPDCPAPALFPPEFVLPEFPNPESPAPELPQPALSPAPEL